MEMLYFSSLSFLSDGTRRIFPLLFLFFLEFIDQWREMEPIYVSTTRGVSPLRGEGIECLTTRYARVKCSLLPMRLPLFRVGRRALARKGCV